MTKNKLAIINGRLMTITNGVIEKGSLLIEDGKIAAIGADIAIPGDAEVIDVQGQVVMPGLIDAHTHISNFSEPGMNKSVASHDGNEATKPITPGVRAEDAINPFEPAIKKVRNAGFTTVCTLPGSANLIGGTGIVFKLRGRSAEEMIIPGTEQMKMALGENPKTCFQERHLIKTRMGNAAVLREALFDAGVYAEKKEEAARKGEYFAGDFNMEALLPVIKGEMRCRIHSHRSDDILTAIKIAEEFGLKYSIEHCTEGYKVKEILAEKGVTAVVGPMRMAPYKQEVWDLRLENAGELAAAGVNICLTADTGSHTCYLPYEAGILVAYGLDEKLALEALTINPARLLAVDHLVGSLEVGKDADIAVFDGHPLSNMTRCRMTIIDGKIYHDRAQDSYLEKDYFSFVEA